MTKNKLIFFAVLMLSILTTSCLKKGCRDIDATNYDKKAKRNDGCTYYSKLKITSVSCITYSSVNAAASPWDIVGTADCFIRLIDVNQNIMFQTEKIDDGTGVLTWTINPNVTITDLSYFFLEMRDYDTGYTNNGSELIVKPTVSLSDYLSYEGAVNKEETGNYPSIIEVSEAGATFELSVIWE